jgi:16S rRNA G527 N7-methylase RsmG
MVIERLQLGDRTVIVTKQFEESIPYDADFITCRAIERFTERIPRILKWAKGRQFLFFGGPSLAEKLDSLDVSYSKTLTPLSRQRYLFASTH